MQTLKDEMMESKVNDGPSNYNELSNIIRLAEQGRAGAQYDLGWMYHHGQDVVEDYKAAIKWYTLSAEQGNAG